MTSDCGFGRRQRGSLFLASIDAAALAADDRRGLWARVVALSIEQHADSFAIEPLGWNRSVKKRELDQLLSPQVDDDGLRPVSDLTSLIIDVGPTVMSLNLYAQRGWVAGVSDWGDNIDVLLERDVWQRAKAFIEMFTPAVSYDVTEAAMRPPPPG